MSLVSPSCCIIENTFPIGDEEAVGVVAAGGVFAFPPPKSIGGVSPTPGETVLGGGATPPGDLNNPPPNTGSV